MAGRGDATHRQRQDRLEAGGILLEPYRATMQDARTTLRSIHAKGEHAFWAMDLPPLDHQPEARTHEELNDAYLLALVKNRAGRLATFDTGIPALAGADAALVELLPSAPPPGRATSQPTN